MSISEVCIIHKKLPFNHDIPTAKLYLSVLLQAKKHLENYKKEVLSGKRHPNSSTNFRKIRIVFDSNMKYEINHLFSYN